MRVNSRLLDGLCQLECVDVYAGFYRLQRVVRIGEGVIVVGILLGQQKRLLSLTLLIEVGEVWQSAHPVSTVAQEGEPASIGTPTRITLGEIAADDIQLAILF